VRRKAVPRTTFNGDVRPNSNPELSPDVLRVLHEKFAGPERDKVAETLREFHLKLIADVDVRVHLNILHAAGNLEYVRKLGNLARKDWRDLIMATEYELRDGKLVQSEWSKAMARKRQERYDAKTPDVTQWRAKPRDE
jgi:hypothetical protein